MRKRQLTALLLLTAALTGCGSMENTQGKPTGEETRQEAEGEKEAKGAEAEKVPGDEPGNETSAGNREVPGDGADVRQAILQGEILQGSMVLEDEEAIYICGTERIRRIEKEGGGSRVLWEKSEDAREAFISMEGKALLVEDSIYFLEEGSRSEGSKEKRSLSVIKTDGTEYRRIAELEDFPKAFYYCDSG